MEFFCPEQCIGNQEVFHLRSSIIVDQCAPVWMIPLSRIEMLIQTGSVKIGKSEGIPWKMRRYPVQDHTDTRLMKRIHEIHKIFR